MNFDGSGKQKLIKADGDYPTWTEDGRIVFTNTTNGYLYIMDADGSDLKQITK
jgi:Tol biopolymer transport system component